MPDAETLARDYAGFLPADLRFAPEPRVEWLGTTGSRVRVERLGDPAAPVRAVLLHGAGGHSGAMRPFSALCARAGAEVLVPDLPGYGLTRTARPGAVRYPQWRDVAVRIVEDSADDRPLLLVGASIGGMLAYDVAALTGAADAVLVTCLLDPSEPSVRRAVARTSWLGAIARPLLRASAGPAAGVRVPVRWLARMNAMSNVPELVDLVVRDRRGGGGRVSLGFLRTYLDSEPVRAPEDWAGPPIVLAHPAQDRWTPAHLSTAFLDRVAGPTRHVPLEGAGHFPVEEPGVRVLADLVRELVESLATGTATG